jgi:hypothetical protein
VYWKLDSQHYGRGAFQPIARRSYSGVSAGSQPTGRINPLALEQLGSWEADRPPRSKSWDEFLIPEATPLDIVLTVCGSAGQACPQFPGTPQRVHWGMPEVTVTGEKQRWPSNAVMKFMLGLPALAAAALLLLIVVFLVSEAWPVMTGRSGVSLLDFFRSGGWYPLQERFGMLPMVWASIPATLGAMLLAMMPLPTVALTSRAALGETMAVLMVAGNVVQTPASLFDPIRVLTANIALEMAYAVDQHRSSLYVSGLLLMAMVAILACLAHRMNRSMTHG